MTTGQRNYDSESPAPMAKRPDDLHSGRSRKPGRMEGSDRMRKMMLVAAAVLCVALVACGGDDDANGGDAVPSADEPAASLTLKLDLVHHALSNDRSDVGRDSDREGSACGVESPFSSGRGSLSFMKVGADVLLKDGAGAILAKSVLRQGSASNIETSGDLDAGTYHAEFDCTWPIGFDGVGAADFYQVEVDGKVVATVSANEVEDGGATVDITP